MSVAIVVDTFPRWSERFIARELNELLRRGVAFKIYCLRAGDVDCERDPEFADLVPLRIVLPSCFLPSFARNMGLDAAAKERMGLVESELGVTAFRQIGCADTLTKLIREHGHEIVYAHFASLPSTLGWLAAAALKLPFVLSCHARDVFVEAQLLEHKMEYARAVFLCNKKALRHIELADCEPCEFADKIKMMPHGLPLEHYPFTPRRARNSLEPGLRLLTAGRFAPKKGFDDLLDALAQPELVGVRVELRMIGEGPERKALAKRIARHGLKDVMMPGQSLGPELRQHFAWADALVVPSVEKNGDSDGLPNVVLEAFAYGLPVIGTDAGSLADALDDSTGWVVSRELAHDDDAQFTHDLALTIRDVFMKADGAAQKALRARQLVEQRFDIRKNIEPLIAELTGP